MSDLEAPDPVPVPDTPPAPPEPPAPPGEPDPEGTIEQDGQKHVPLATLIEERRTKQGLKAKADQYDQLVGYVNQAKPYIEFLQANPHLMQPGAVGGKPTPANVPQPEDDAAADVARMLDLYTADGKPDVARAQKLQAWVDKTADSKADARVKPLEQSTTRERSSYMYQRALVTKAPDGRQVDRDLLDALWQRTDPTITATEEGASGLVAMALGLTVMKGGQPAPVTPPPSAPPLHTESPGSRTPTRHVMTEFDRSIAKIRGLDDKTYAERTKGFTPGRPSVLEE